MSYEVFARKYRPKTFNEVVGQEAVVKTLENSLKAGRIGQAYLFSGMRGTGKTTVARILAKALNCERDGNRRPRPDPCPGTESGCEMCRSIDEGRAIDVQEIDGASNRGIDEIRSLRESVRYKPLIARYKVVIIDEVHQISKDAFNALLKTIEEPPEKTVFIFATTEFHKVPATIVSRCQHFEFKKLNHKDIIKQLEMIAGKEGLKVSPAGLAMIADAADGSMRDAQSLLDQAVSLSGNEIQEEDLKILLRSVSRESLIEFAEAVIGERPDAVFGLVDRIVESGYDLKYFFARLIEHFRALLVVKTVDDPADFLFVSRDELEALKVQTEKAGIEDILRYVTAMQQAEQGLRYSSLPRVYLETFLVRLCQFRKIVPLKELIAAIDKSGDAAGLSASAGSKTSQPARASAAGQAGPEPPARPYPPKQDVKNETIAERKKTDQARGVFDLVIERISKDMAALAVILKEYSSVRIKDELVEVFFPTGKGFLVSTLRPDNLRTIEKAAGAVLGRPVNIRFSEENAAEGEPIKPTRLVETALKDPAVKYFMDSFKGQIISVDPIKSSHVSEAKERPEIKEGNG